MLYIGRTWAESTLSGDPVQVSFGDHQVDSLVMFIGGHGGQELKGETRSNPDGALGNGLQEEVIETCAPPKSMPQFAG